MTELQAVLSSIVGKKHVICDPAELLVYESDGLTIHRATPRAVVFVTSTLEVFSSRRLPT